MPTLYDNFSQVKQYIDQNQVDLSSYVSKSELSEMSYATTSQLPVIDENLIPKENNTYTLGDQNYLYSATYTSRVKVGNNSQMYNDSGGITFSINSNNGVRIGSSAIYPKTSGGFSLGSSSNVWGATYTEKLYFNSGNEFYNDNSYQIVLKLNNSDKYVFRTEYIRPISNNGASLGLSNFKFSTTYTSNLYADTIHNFIWTGTSAEYAALSDYTTYQIYMIKKS